jgi:hypothetical protein
MTVYIIITVSTPLPGSLCLQSKSTDKPGGASDTRDMLWGLFKNQRFCQPRPKLELLQICRESHKGISDRVSLLHLLLNITVFEQENGLFWVSGI